MSSTDIYYVYAYLRHDQTPYYIGKGKGKRAFEKHRCKVPIDKSNIKIIAHKLSEHEAFLLEKKLVSIYGRKDLKTGILHNLTDGGEGVSGPKSESHKKAIGKALKGRNAYWIAEVVNKDPEKIRKTAEWHTGKKRPQETKDKLSKIMKERNLKNGGSLNKGMKCFYNPETLEVVQCFPNDKPDNWLPGTGKKKPDRGVWFHNRKGEIKAFKTNDVIPEGWVIGRK